MGGLTFLRSGLTIPVESVEEREFDWVIYFSSEYRDVTKEFLNDSGRYAWTDIVLNGQTLRALVHSVGGGFTSNSMHTSLAVCIWVRPSSSTTVSGDRE